MGVALPLAGLLLAAGLGYAGEKKRIDVEQRQKTETAMTNMMMKQATEGNPDLADLLKSPDILKWLPKQAVPAFVQFAQMNIRQRQRQEAGLRGEQATPPIAELTGAGTQTANGGVQMAPFAPPQPAQSAAAPAERQEYVTAPQPAAPVQQPSPAASKTPGKLSEVDDLLSRSYIEPTELNRTKAKSLSTPLYGGGTKTEVAADDDELGRRVLAAGATKGMKYTSIVEAITRKGYKVTDDVKAYGEAQWTKAFQAAMTGVNTSDVVGTKDAARRAYEATGIVPEKFKDLIAPTPEDEGAMHYKMLMTALGQNKSLPEAMAIAGATGLRPNLQLQNDAITKYSQNFRTQIEKYVPGLAPEQYDNLTRYATGGMGLSPEQAKGVVQPVPQSDEERAATFRKTGTVPRMGDLPGGQGQVTGPMLEGIHKTVQGEAVAQAGAKAGTEAQAKLNVEVADRPAKAAQVGAETTARVKAESDVPRRPDAQQVKEAESLKNAHSQLQAVGGLYSPEYVGKAKGKGGEWQEYFGGTSRREAAFRASHKQFVNEAIFYLTGKQMSIQEAERILGPLPQFFNTPEVFEARKAALIDQMKRKAETQKETLTQGGFKGFDFNFPDHDPKTNPTERLQQLFDGLPEDERKRLNRLGGDKMYNDPTMKDIGRQLKKEFPGTKPGTPGGKK